MSINDRSVPGKRLDLLYAEGWRCVAVLQPAQPGDKAPAVILLEREV